MRFGVPCEIVTDQGTQFTSKLVKALLEQYQVKHCKSTSYHPVEAPKIGSTTRGIQARSGPWLATPYPFGIAGPTGDMGPVSQSMSVYV